MGVAIVLTVSVVVFMVMAGSERTTEAYFWVDLIVGTATAALFVALAQNRMRWLSSVLSTRPLAAVGAFAFSLYFNPRPRAGNTHLIRDQTGRPGKHPIPSTPVAPRLSSLHWGGLCIFSDLRATFSHHQEFPPVHHLASDSVQAIDNEMVRHETAPGPFATRSNESRELNW